MEPRNDKAIEFLSLVYPEGPWVLTAISTDRKSIETRTFSPNQNKALANWLESHNGRRNIYWHVNPVIKPVTKKAEREDIKEVAFLHVDIDPRAGEDLEAERLRAVKLLERPPQEVPMPTCIIFSGGGLQAFWKLAQPIPINGDLAKAEDAKRYNLQLELVFGADNCHNIDRIMRLPGTINIPDAKKKKKGRKEELAELLEWHADRIYDLDKFKPAQVVQYPEDKGFSNPKNVQISGNIKRLGDVEELNEWNVPDRVKVIIVQGRVPDEHKEGDDSRSAWLFDCICQLVRCEVPDDIIFSIITDPDFGISESVLDKGANSSKYATRQIERAKEEAVNPWLRKLNEQHAVIGNMGGKCRIIEEVFDFTLNRPRLTRQSFDDFRNRYMNRFIEVGRNKEGQPVTHQVGKWWLNHPQRRQYDTIVFAPGREVDGVYNLWKGFACESRPGNCKLFLDHVRENICHGNDAYYDYLTKWMARTVQKPDSPGQTAIVMRGKQGVGKSFFAKHFGSLFGRHFLQVADPKHLVGSFNSHLRDCVVLFGDEAFYAGDKKHESVLKMLITEETITFEAKGIDAEAGPNFTHVLLASNAQWVVPAGADERRFFVLDVSDQHKQDTTYFRKIQRQFDSGGREALLHFLLTLDLEGFDVRIVPKTDALKEQKLMSLSPEEEWWYRKLVEGRVFRYDENWKRIINKEELYRDYVKYMQQAQIISRRSNETILGRFLSRMCPGLASKQLLRNEKVPNEGGDGWSKTVRRRSYFYQLPELEKCRKAWTDLFGIESWEDPSKWEDYFEEQEELPKEKEPF